MLSIAGRFLSMPNKLARDIEGMQSCGLTQAFGMKWTSELADEAVAVKRTEYEIATIERVEDFTQATAA